MYFRALLFLAFLIAEVRKELLLSVQVSLLQDSKTKRKFLFPSNYDDEVKKIYKIMEVEMLNRAIIVSE